MRREGVELLADLRDLTAMGVGEVARSRVQRRARLRKAFCAAIARRKPAAAPL